MKFFLLSTLIASSFSAAAFNPPADNGEVASPSNLKSAITKLQDVVKDLEKIEAKGTEPAKPAIDPKFDFKAY